MEECYFYFECYLPATLLKVTLLHECFSHFLNYTNGTKIAQSILYSHWVLNNISYNYTLTYAETNFFDKWSNKIRF